MFRMIIVDDERETAEMLRDVIEWPNYGIDVIDIAFDGSEAYKSIMLHKPDIIITDVCMPHMNGIELIRKTYDSETKVKFIIISAFADFEFARDAMQYGVKHYLLKPSGESQVVGAVNEVVTDIIQERARKSSFAVQNDTKRERTYFSPQVESILQIVDEQFGNPALTLKWISENKVFANKDYLSRRFLQDTGHKFKEYLVSMRISKAKELMFGRNNETIMSIAEKVGFGDNPQYFSLVFKKNTGMSPYEYKKYLIGKNR